jgi:predicted lipoprotein with Yx(FWY)xxD motif
MRKNKLKILLQLFLAIAVVTATGCKKSDSSPAPNTGTLIKLAVSTTLGQYLVDKNGVTLYYFSNDSKGLNTCSGGCAAYWPYFYAANLTQDNLMAGLNITDFDTIHVGSAIQTRYKGWPLYYYSPGGNSVPEAAGLVTGESVENWFVAKPDYTIMLANAQLVGGDGLDYLSTYKVGAGKTVYFTDAKGLTLYIFTPDSFNINKYTKPDFSNNTYWPIYDTIQIVVPSSLDKTLFSSITVYGKHQLTYKGWPLYYYGNDGKTRGNTKGITVPTPGSKWPVAVKDLGEAPHK